MKPYILIPITFIAFATSAISQKNNTASEQTTYYQYDGLGNTVSLTDVSGNIVENYSYSVFGEPVIKNAANQIISASAFGNRFLFTGREFLKQLNIYDYRNRIYSASSGRFIQTDPLRYGAGDYTLYRYVGNDAVNTVDLFGLGFVDKNGNPGPALTLDNSTHWDFEPNIPECDGAVSPTTPPSNPPTTSVSSGGVVYSKRSDMKLLNKPDYTSPGIHSADWNEPLNVVTTEGKWIQVERANGERGWLYNRSISNVPLLKEPRSNFGIKAEGATAGGARG